jgi:hypothetical protein
VVLSPEAVAESARLFDEGLKAADLGQWEKAREHFQGAWRIRHHWKVAVNLGRAELKVGKNRDAAEHLTYFLREAPADIGEAARKEPQQLLDKALAKVGRLNITVNPPGAEVLVDGHVVGLAPLPGPVFVEPGLVFVEARLEGFAQTRVSQTAAAGKEEAVNLVLVRPLPGKGALGGAVPTRPAPAPGGEASPNSAKRVAGFVVGGVGVAGLGVGAVTGILSLVKHAAALNACPKHKDCSQEAFDTGSSGNMLSTVSTVAFAVGLVGVGIGTGLLISSRAEKKSSVGLLVLPGGGGISARGEF